MRGQVGQPRSRTEDNEGKEDNGGEEVVGRGLQKRYTGRMFPCLREMASFSLSFFCRG
jgi:hypothetical protein